MSEEQRKERFSSWSWRKRAAAQQVENRVRKSENFPYSKIFVAKTLQIKCVNRVNFQIRFTYAKYKVYLQILSISMVPNKLHGVHLYEKLFAIKHFID